MLFNSIDFAIFLPIVFALYWFVFPKNLKVQNAFLLLVSYIFYGWWDWHFLWLIALSSMVDFGVGLGLAGTENKRHRRLLLFLSLTVNLGLLAYFKYCNFFLDNFVEAFRFFGFSMSPRNLEIVLPVGISFYTFQTLSYSIDVYRQKIKATKDVLSFFAFVSFFPQLVAGPIERASALLPQFHRPRVFDHHKAVDGMRQILWGLFKKIVIADNCATFVDEIFPHYADHTGSTLLLAVFLFSLQIYGDFSGYSDIAIGTARLFGFDLMKNFSFPYFSRDIAEFWRRWHISLSTWFRDYVYIPLGGSRGSTTKTIRNIFIIFIVSGFWHGANWTFVVWGTLHALYFLPLMLRSKNRKNLNVVAEGKIFPRPKELAQIVTTFALTLIAWVFFRADNLGHAFSYLGQIFSASLFETSKTIEQSLTISIVVLIVIEWCQRLREHGLHWGHESRYRLLRWPAYFALIMAIFLCGGSQHEFVYFQF